ncbi:zeta toxin-domain-containing protein [Chaetomium fimeti]|uniref:Zeta toxin-domain-containing protein n=1 Tax=Chaetomium fimeti TaxID=1854472 RepID=A0AAE0LT23_9PEZI|nr:zeta toxin-domain-containing protein [Chaetomium fimeti]
MEPTEAPSHAKPQTTTPSNPPTTNTASRSPEEIARLLAGWQITPETHAHILHTRILPTVLHPFLPAAEESTANPQPQPQPQPLAVLLLGQTGAGKTHLAPLLANAFSQQPPSPFPSPSTSPPQPGSQPLPQHPPLSTPQPTPPGQPPHPNRRRNPPLHLTADAYKTHHPHFHTCLAALPATPHLASRLAGPDAARWLEEVCAAAAQARVDVLVETACRRGGGGEGMGRLVGGFVQKGYGVRVVVLGVASGVSWLGVVGRFWRGVMEMEVEKGGEGEVKGDGEGGDGKKGDGGNREKGEGREDKEKGGRQCELGGPMPLRLTPRVVHDESLEGLRGAVGWLDGEGARASEDDKGRVERVVVVRRGLGVVYDNKRIKGGRWEKEPGALKALEREWGRALTEEERRTAEEDIKMLMNLKKPDVDREIEEVQKLIAGLGATDGAMPDMVPFDAVDFIHKELS